MFTFTKTRFYLTLWLNVRRTESLIPRLFRIRANCFHIFEIDWMEKDKIFNPSIHSSTRLFKSLSLHMWDGNISSLLAGLLKDRLRLLMLFSNYNLLVLRDGQKLCPFRTILLNDLWAFCHRFSLFELFKPPATIIMN